MMYPSIVTVAYQNVPVKTAIVVNLHRESYFCIKYFLWHERALLMWIKSARVKRNDVSGVYTMLIFLCQI